MKTEKPIRVIKRKSAGDGHARETRIFAREIHESYCDHRRCRFYGQPSVQGVCHTTKPDLVEWERLDRYEAEQANELAEVRKANKGRRYVEWLEAMYTTVNLNWRLTLDECIRLRRDNAILRSGRAPGGNTRTK